MCPPWSQPVSRDDASLERTVSVTPDRPVLTLRVGGSGQEVTEGGQTEVSVRRTADVVLSKKNKT